MAENAENTTPNAMDYTEHNRTFDIFMTLVKWGTVAVVLVLIFMAVFLL